MRFIFQKRPAASRLQRGAVFIIGDLPQGLKVGGAVKPDYALGSNVAALGLDFARSGEKGGTYPEVAFIRMHRSWNRQDPPATRLRGRRSAAGVPWVNRSISSQAFSRMIRLPAARSAYL